MAAAATAAAAPAHEMHDDVPEFLDPAALTTDQVWQLLHRETFDRFLRDYGAAASGNAWESTYGQQAVDIARHGYEGFTVREADVNEWTDGTALMAFLAANFLHVWPQIDASVDAYVKSVLERYLAEGGTEGGPTVDNVMLHDGAHKNFHVVWLSEAPSQTVRDLRCEQIGKILRLRGTVTRVSDTRPLLATATFRCGICGAEQRDVPQQLRYTEPTQCASRGDRPCLNRTFWILVPELSTYRDWQKLRVQENSGEIPAGSMPRAIDVLVTRSQCDAARAGDKIIVTGATAAVPDAMPKDRRPAPTETSETGTAIAGIRKLGVRDLGHRMVFLGASIETSGGVEDSARLELPEDPEDAAERQAADLEAQFKLLGLTREEQLLFMRIAKSDDTLERLAACFAPEVFGCENIKKGILLMLASGVAKNTGAEGLRLRGDINVCIVGDPGTAKSQLLRAVRNFAPRAVYAAGSTSSAAGLTVAVTRDPEQGDGVIEAGALMLADTGVCCIDEFEKMNVKDMVAIHEAVEQQTISVCKGGVHAVLNARASILAACNPRGGRYDLSMPFRHNVRLSAPIISRFDLFFALVDATDLDRQVAAHILDNHRGGATAGHLTTELNKKQLQNYMKIAKDRQPILSPAAQRLLVQVYVELRAESSKPGGGRSAAVTVRSLESLIRLSEAAAKIKFASAVSEEHVRMAVRVVQTSLIRLKKTKILLAEDSEETIDSEVYARISANILEHFRDAELQLAAETGGDARETTAEKDELVSWYVEQNAAEGDDDETLMQQYQLVAKVIDRMVHKDMTLIEDVRISAAENGESDAPMVTLLRLHPNFADVAEIPHGVHATLSTEFLAGSLNEAANAAGAGVGDLLNDEDFMRHVYGP